MKKVIIFCLLLAITAGAFAQSASYKDVFIRGKLTFVNKAIDGIQTDTSFLSDTKLPTSLAIAKYVAGHSVGGGGSADSALFASKFSTDSAKRNMYTLSNLLYNTKKEKNDTLNNTGWLPIWRFNNLKTPTLQKVLDSGTNSSVSLHGQLNINGIDGGFTGATGMNIIPGLWALMQYQTISLSKQVAVGAYETGGLLQSVGNNSINKLFAKFDSIILSSQNYNGTRYSQISVDTAANGFTFKTNSGGYKLPSTTPSNNQVLKAINGSGGLAWSTLPDTTSEIASRFVLDTLARNIYAALAAFSGGGGGSDDGNGIYSGNGNINTSTTVTLNEALKFTDFNKVGFGAEPATFKTIIGSVAKDATFLEVDNNTNTVEIGGGNLVIPLGAGNGKVLTSDGSGFATWETAPSADLSSVNARIDSFKIQNFDSTEFRVADSSGEYYIMLRPGIFVKASDTTGMRPRLNAGTNISSITGTYPNLTINAATQTTDTSGIRVRLNPGTNITSITGTYPNLTINAATQTTDTSNLNTRINLKLNIASPSATGLLTVTGTTQTGSSATGIYSATQTWNTSGNVIADLINITNTSSGASSLLMDRQVGGVSQFKVAKNGDVTTLGSVAVTGSVSANNILNGSTGYYGWGGRSRISSAADGKVVLYNAAFTDFAQLQFGGLTSSFPSLKRSTTTLQVVLADDSGFGAMQSLYDRFGSGSPEGAVTAPVGAVYHRTDGGAGTSFYVKESGSGNTGWVAK